MVFTTDECLKSRTDTYQLLRERMCRSVLSIDKRFSEVKPRHPRGGPDGGRDIQAIYKDDLITFGAVGFKNQANDSKEHKNDIKKKFKDDLNSAMSADIIPKAFVFFTNVNFTLLEKEELRSIARNKGIEFCEVFDREQIRINLDSPDGFAIRFQYLNIPLSEAEQKSFFAKWGDDIQSVISTGFQKIDRKLDHLLFLQEATYALENFQISFELDKEYSPEEIGHLRLFGFVGLIKPIENIDSLLFGIFDGTFRLDKNSESSEQELKSGIRYGIGSAQWTGYNKKSSSHDDEEFTLKSKGMHKGIPSSVTALTISYDVGLLANRNLLFRDIDQSEFLPILNKSFAEKVKAVHVVANGYKIQETSKSEFFIDTLKTESLIPIDFTEVEMKDSWVALRPNSSSLFYISFSDQTPKRLFTSQETTI